TTAPTRNLRRASSCLAILHSSLLRSGSAPTVNCFHGGYAVSTKLETPPLCRAGLKPGFKPALQRMHGAQEGRISPRGGGGFVQEFRQQVLPPFGIAGGAVAGSLGRCRDFVIAAVLHPFDFTRSVPQFDGIALVVTAIDGEHARGDLLQIGGRIVI